VHHEARLLPFGALHTAPSIIQATVQSIPGFFEPISSLSHLLAAAVGAAGAISLLRHGRGGRARFVAVAIYAFSVVTLLAISGTYHSLPDGGHLRGAFRRLDYGSIWLLIAGTFTAIHGVMHRGRWRSWMLGAVWTLAAAGIVLQTVRFELFSGPAGWIFYAGVAGVGVLSIVKLGRQLGFRAVWPIWTAGLVYAVGAALEARRFPTLIAGSVGPHEVFHFAVLAGIALHWKFIRQVLTKFAPAPALAAAR
jgi:channel protein (hemolysin III family)